MNVMEFVFLAQLTISCIVEENIIYIVIGTIELFPISFMVKAILTMLIKKLKSVKERVLQRCTYDTKYRNRIASFLFFFADMGPNVSSFSVIALFITTDENVIALTFVFVCGIIMKEVFREFKNKFYKAIEQRSS